MKKNKSISIILIAIIVLFTSCSDKNSTTHSPENENSTVESSVPNKSKPVGELESAEITAKNVNPYDDIRYFDWDEENNKGAHEESEYNQEDIFTFTFNQGTVLDSVDMSYVCSDAQ